MNLYEAEQYKGLKIAHRLTESHLKPTNFQKMNVRKAAQVFSRTVAMALSHYRRIEEKDERERRERRQTVMEEKEEAGEDPILVLEEEKRKEEEGKKKKFKGIRDKNEKKIILIKI